MKLKKEYLILLLIIVALSVYLMMRSQNQTHYKLPHVASTESKKIDRILITKNGKSFELDKKDDQWTVGPKSYAADAVKARNMVKAATDLTISDLISESGNYERYDLTDDRKIDVQAFAGGTKVRDFAVGKASPTYQHTFVRLANDPNVYTARGQLNHIFAHTISDLRDLTVLSFDKDAITGMEIQKAKQSLTLAKKEIMPPEKKETAKDAKPAEKKQTGAQPRPQWQDANGKAVDQPAVQRLLNDFCAFKCNTYLADDAAKDLKDKTPRWTLTFKGGNANHSLTVYDNSDPKATEFTALSSSRPYAFTVAKSKEESIEKLMDKLLGQTPDPK
jgi:Domain of unknown function (DUF4340)